MRQDKGQEKIEKSADVKDGYNVGLSLLRAFMCFSVILCHFWGNFDTGWRGWLSFFKGYAVPVFMLMSFFLTEKTLMSYDKKKIRKRLERLLIPFVLWPLVYWLVYNIVDLCKSGYGLGCSITDLLWQLFMGHSPKLNVLMWYQFDLIILSLLLAAIIYVFRKNYIHILCACMMAAWLLQYSGWNKLFFGGLRFEMTYPLGRLAEMFPYAACGFLMAHFGICKKLEKYQGGVFIIAVSFIYIVRYYPVFAGVDGYYYGGFKVLGIAISLMVLFYFLPAAQLPKRILKLIKKLTRFTMGIYGINMLVGQLLKIAFAEFGIAINPFKQCVLIYILCYSISYGISKIPVRFVKKLVE